MLCYASTRSHHTSRGGAVLLVEGRYHSYLEDREVTEGRLQQSPHLAIWPRREVFGAGSGDEGHNAGPRHHHLGRDSGLQTRSIRGGEC